MTTAPDYFSLGGTLPVGSPSYLARRADDELRETMLAHRYALVLDSRQKGKSSLLAHVAADLRDAGYKILKLDLQRFGSTLTSDQWYSALLLAAGEQLDAFEAAQKVRKSQTHESLAQRWIGFLEYHAESSHVGLVVFIDEVDFLRSLPFDTDDFLAVIRSSFQRRSERAGLRKLIFCFCGASTPAGLVRNAALGEMIIGTRITLQDFSRQELTPYLDHLVKAGEDPGQVLGRIHQWTGGHPYLTQLACAEWNRHGKRLSSIDEFFRKQTATVGNQHQSDHLVALSRAVLNVQLPDLPVEESRIRVLDALAQIVRSRRLPATKFPRGLIDLLLICGVIREEGSALMIRNRIYQEAFNPQWIRDHLPNSEVRRQQRAARRAFAVSGGLALAIIGILGSLAFQNSQLAGRLQGALTQAQLNERDARLEAYVGAMQSVSAEMQDGNMMRAGLVLDSLQQSPLRGWEWHYAKRVASTEVASLASEAPVHTWMLDLQGRIVAISNNESTTFLDAEGRAVSRIPHGMALSNPRLVGDGIVISVPTGTMTIQPDGSSEVTKVALISQTERHEVRWDDFNKLMIISGPGGSEPLSVPMTGRPMIATHDDRLRKLVVRVNDQLLVYDLSSGLLERTFKGFLTINDFVIDSKHKRLFVATDRTEVQSFDLITGKELPMLIGNEGPVKSLAVSGKSSTLLTGGSDGITRRYDTETGTLRSVHYGHQGSVLRVAFGRDAETFLTSSNDNTVKTWRPDRDDPQRVIEVGSNEAPRFRIGLFAPRLVGTFPDGFAASALIDGRSKPVVTLQSSGLRDVARAVVNKDEAVFLRSDGKLRWESKAGPKEIMLGTLTEGAVQMASNEESSKVLILRRTGIVLEVDLETGQTRSFGEKNDSNAVSCAVGGARLAIGFKNGTYELWDTESLLRIHRSQERVVLQNIEFSPTGENFAVSFGDGQIHICEARTGETIHTLRGHTSRVWRASFSLDGRLLTSCSFDNSARIWDVASGRELQRLQMKSWVGDASFNPDATRVVTACGDGSVRLWSVATGREVFIIYKQKDPVFSVRFTPDGNWIVAGTNGGKFLIWNGSPQPSGESPEN